MRNSFFYFVKQRLKWQLMKYVNVSVSQIFLISKTGWSIDFLQTLWTSQLKYLTSQRLPHGSYVSSHHNLKHTRFEGSHSDGSEHSCAMGGDNVVRWIVPNVSKDRSAFFTVKQSDDSHAQSNQPNAKGGGSRGVQFYAIWPIDIFPAHQKLCWIVTQNPLALQPRFHLGNSSSHLGCQSWCGHIRTSAPNVNMFFREENKFAWKSMWGLQSRVRLRRADGASNLDCSCNAWSLETFGHIQTITQHYCPTDLRLCHFNKLYVELTFFGASLQSAVQFFTPALPHQKDLSKQWH
jgi:hypothetical protein